MGKVILCSGRMARTGLPLPDGGRVYSVEELCYYVYQNIYGIEEKFFTGELTDWLEQECGMPEAAEKLRWLRKEDYSSKDMTVALLCSADYYTEPEIIELIRKMNELENMPEWRRRKHVADEYRKQERYSKARTEYEKILEECVMTEEDRGIVLHNIGITRLHTTSLPDAAETFYRAYRTAHRPESLKLCLLAYQMGGCEEEYRRILDAEPDSRDIARQAGEEWNHALAEADQTAQMKLLDEIVREKQNGMVTEAYEGLGGLLDRWKQKYRDGIMR